MSRTLVLARSASIGITLFCCFLLLTDISWLKQLKQRLEYISYDLRMVLAPPPKQSEQHVAIVAIDEKSLQELGRWPWPRQAIAQLTDRLAQAHAAVAAFDIIFAEPSHNALDEFLSTAEQSGVLISDGQKQQLLDHLDNDAKLEKSLRKIDAVLGFILQSSTTSNQNVLPEVSRIQPPLPLESLNVRQLSHYTGNLPMLQQAAPYGAFVTTQPDSDGVLRRSPLLLAHGDAIYPSLALECARLFMLLDSVELETAPIGTRNAIETVKLGEIRIPADRLVNMLVPYLGPSPSFKHVSATDVIHGRVPASELENRIVLIGTTALGLTDFVATPVQNVFPGVEVHANMIEAILQQRFLKEPPWSLGAELALIVCTGILLAFLLPGFSARWQIGISCAALLLMVAFFYYLWVHHGLALDMSTPLGLVLILFIFNLAYGFLCESQSKLVLQKMFGQYVPPERVKAMARSGKLYQFVGESRELSVLFADIRNFTTLSESLDPAALKQWLNQFFTHMTGIIFEHHGTIDKYVGDMIMAFWGAPLENPYHARDAVAAARAMLAKTEALRAEFRAQRLPEISIGIGINTGVMNVGDMGSNYRRSYTVLGDAVNLASRIEGLTKFYGADLVVGEQTARALSDYVLQCLDSVRVKGKNAAVKVYRPLGLKKEAETKTLDYVEAFHTAQNLYLQQQWDASRAHFERLSQAYPDEKICKLYLERIATLSNLTLDAEWDGVYERREK